MGKLKNSLRADAIANLYRCALYLGLGNSGVALSFLKKYLSQMGKKQLGDLGKIIYNPLLIASKKDRLFWAEKALDQYKCEMSLLVSKS